MLFIFKKVFRTIPKGLSIAIIVLFAAAFFFVVAVTFVRFANIADKFDELQTKGKDVTPIVSSTEPIVADKYEKYTIQCIDVGQADCTYITNGSDTMLIDAGNNEDGRLIVNHLKKMGVTEIDYLIGTHPHEDHIGGLDDIIKNFDIGTLILPDCSADTQTYMDVIDAASNYNVEIHIPMVGEQWKIGQATCTVLSCQAVNDVTDLNEWSIVIHLDTIYKDFLFMADATNYNEAEIIKSGINIDADVLRCAHHGSADANTNEFLRAVSPDYIVISVGENNEYGHPHSTVLNTFFEIADYTMTTKDHGTIEFTLSIRGMSYELISTNCDGLNS